MICSTMSTARWKSTATRVAREHAGLPRSDRALNRYAALSQRQQ